MTEPEEFTLPAQDLRDVFDIAVASMDFSSGFLDNREVDALRRIAVAIGVDPMSATPSNFVRSYPHAFRGVFVNSGAFICRYCSGVADDAWHEESTTPGTAVAADGQDRRSPETKD